MNYLIGNGLSIELDDGYIYKNLLKGFTSQYRKKLKRKIMIDIEIEKSPEVYLDKLWVKLATPPLNKTYLAVYLDIVANLSSFITERILSIKTITHLLYKFKNPEIIITTNYDNIIETNFHEQPIHIHGSVDDPSSIVFASRRAKEFVTNTEPLLIMEGELAILGVVPGYDKHIWGKIINNNKLTKIYVSYFTKDDKIAVEKLAAADKRFIPISKNDFWLKFITKRPN